jgi:hypothetical protein
MMRTARLVLLVLATPVVAAIAQTGVLFGRVLDAQSGAPLANAEINFAQKRVTTDSSGKYRLTDVAAGVNAIQVRRLGYELLQQNVSVIIGVESETDFRLARVVSLDTVQTKATAIKYISPALTQFEERRKMGIGKFIDEATMRKNDDRTLGNTLKRLPGVRVHIYNSSEYVASSRSSGGGQAGALRGGGAPRADPQRADSPRACWVAVYLDGLMIYNGDPRQAAPDMNKILVRELAGAEFYSGSASAPAQFSAIKSSDCGVLLLWSRER